MPSNSLPEADLNLPEMKTKSLSCPSGGFHMYVLMVQKVGEINQMNPLLFCLQKLWKTGLFHQLFEPL